MRLDLSLIRRDLHRHPEVAFEEHWTAGVVEQHLRSLGLKPQRLAGTGVVAEITGDRRGPLIALRADLDALPLEEQTGLPFASEIPGRMHACGHDLHMAMLLGAADRLLTRRRRIAGRVRLIFQPGEEVTEGARKLVEAGALEGVRAIFALHNDPRLRLGTVAIKAGPAMAASARFLIVVQGVGGHGAMPHKAADPLVAAAAILTGLQTAVSRMVNPLEPLVVTVGRMQGGATFNVIPDRAELEGTIRCYSEELQKAVPGWLEQIAENTARGYRCQAEFTVDHLVPVVWNEERSTKLAQAVSQRMLGPEGVLEAMPSMGAEDFSVYLQHVPGCFIWIGSDGPFGLHHPSYLANEGCLTQGADLLCELALAAGVEFGKGR